MGNVSLGRGNVSFAVALAILLAASAAHAGAFGGFASDGKTYLTGTDQVCGVLAPSADARPACDRADARAVATAQYRTGDRQTRKGFRAEARGRRIAVFAPGASSPLVEWNAGAVVSRIVAVYAGASGSLVAVEYEARSLGRAQTEAIAFRVGTAAAAPTAAAPIAPAPEPAPAGPSPDLKARATALRDRADRLLARRRYKPALAAYADALAIDDTDLAARYGVAIASARLKRRDDALAALRRLYESTRPEAKIYLLEAARDDAFRALRNDPAFRRYAGLDRKPPKDRSKLTAYERLLGHGGTWEQALVACERARVTLALEPRPREFSLRIESRCQGSRDVTELGGTWDSEGNARLLLVLPNDEATDEQLLCDIGACGEEDCVRCDVDVDLAFELRPVRR